MNETQIHSTRPPAGVFAISLITLALCAPAYPQQKPLAGFEVDPRMAGIVPKRFIVDPPTIENLGFRWYVEGDGNRNASVAVAFRKRGQVHWKEALPMLRIHHEVSNQKDGVRAAQDER